MENSDDLGIESSDNDSDIDGFFLEPTLSSLSIAEKVADANKLLFAEDTYDGTERIQKVRFCEKFETFNPPVSQSNSDINSSCEESCEKHEGNKLLLVLVPNIDHSSSCESEPENAPKIVKEEEKPKFRPKSANKSAKIVKNDIKIAKISPEFNPQPIRSKSKTVKYPKALKACCIAKENLPKYNGLHSEYGLSAEQLDERKRKTFQAKQQRKELQMKLKSKEMERRKLNDDKFWEWLREKSQFIESDKKPKKDSLTRSDLFIQNNAVYATKTGVVYAVDYSMKKTRKEPKIHRKTVNLAKLFENLSPGIEKTYKIYVDSN